MVGYSTYPPEANEILQRSERNVHTIGKRVAQEQHEELVIGESNTVVYLVE